MQVWNVLLAARWKYRTQKWCKNRHLRTIAQLCRAVSSQLRHLSTIGKKLVKQQYLHISSQYGELRPTNGWDLLSSLGHPSKFQRVSRLGRVTARHSSTGRQPNFAALNRGYHLYLAGRTSRWALAHISSFTKLCCDGNSVNQINAEDEDEDDYSLGCIRNEITFQYPPNGCYFWQHPC